MQQLPLISIITVQYKNQQVTEEFLHSIGRYCSYTPIQVIVVDNDPASGNANALTDIRPDALVVKAPGNLGFAGGNNLGAKCAAGDFYFFVNNDTEFTPGLLEALVESFSEYPDAGIVSPKFRYYFSPDTIEYAGYEKVSPLTARNKMIGCGLPDRGQFDTPGATHYAHGGAMMVSRKVFDASGGMPEEFFLYYEEFDWCEQIKKLGFKIYYQPKALIYHKESMSTGKKSPLKTYYITRNRILFMRRNRKAGAFFAFCVYLCLFTIPKNSFSFLLRREFDHLKAFWKGIGWHFNNRIIF